MPLMNYTTNVLTVKNFSFVGRETELLFGIELETKTRPTNEQIDLVNSSASWIAKKDSSVEAEYVSIPMSVNEATEKIAEVQSVIHDVYADNTTGMHVHVNRNFFKGFTEITAFINLINGAVMDKNPLIEREPNQFADLNFYYSSSRYQVVNITSRTLEVRIFKGTNDVDLIIKRLKWLAKLALLVNKDPKLGFVTDKSADFDVSPLLDFETEKRKFEVEKRISEEELKGRWYKLFEVENRSYKYIESQRAWHESQMQRDKISLWSNFYFALGGLLLIGVIAIFPIQSMRNEARELKQHHADMVLTQMKLGNKTLNEYISCGPYYDEGSDFCVYKKVDELILDASPEMREYVEDNPSLFKQQWRQK